MVLACAGIAGLCLVGAAWILFAPESALAHVALPLAERASKDGEIGPDSVAFLRRMLSKAALGLLGAAWLPLAYAWLWRALPERLAAARASRPADAPPDVLVGAQPPGVVRAFLPRRGRLAALVFAPVALSILAGRQLGRGFEYDEIFSALHFIETGSWWETVSSQSFFNNHVGFSLAARIGQGLLGVSEVTARLPALLMALATLAVGYRLGRRLVGPGAAALATALLAISPAFVTAAASARGYAGLVLGSTSAVLLYLDLLRGAGRGRAWALAIVSALGVWCHLYVGLVVATLAAHLVLESTLRARRTTVTAAAFRRTWLALTGATVLSMLLLAPVLPQVLYYLSIRRDGSFQWLFPFEALFEVVGGPGPFAGAVVLWVLVEIGQGLASVRSGPARRLVGLLVFAPLLLMWLVVRPYDLYPRFFLFILPLLWLLASHGLAQMGAETSWWPAFAKGFARLTVILLIPALIALSWFNVPEEGYRDAARAASAMLEEDTQLFAIGGGGELFRYYTERDPRVPETEAAFDAIVARAGGQGDVIVLHRPTAWEPEAHGRIAARLALRGRTEHFGEIRMYVWER